MSCNFNDFVSLSSTRLRLPEDDVGTSKHVGVLTKYYWYIYNIYYSYISYISIIYNILLMGTAVEQWLTLINPLTWKIWWAPNNASRWQMGFKSAFKGLRCWATNRKVAGSIPTGIIGNFYWHNPPDRTISLVSTQPLTEMSTRSISWG